MTRTPCIKIAGAVITLRGSVALVTGASSGIGRTLALALSQAGTHLLLIGRHAERLQVVASAAREAGVSTLPIQMDLTDPCAVRALGAAALERFGHLDIVVHSAGTYYRAPIAATDDLCFMEQLRVSAMAALAVSRHLLPLLVESQGQFVFVNSSVVGARRAELAAYGAGQRALSAVADSLREEVNAAGVRVLSVFVGRTATPMQERIYQQEHRPYDPSLLLQPEDVAEIVLAALALPRTAEVTDLHIRPMRKSL